MRQITERPERFIGLETLKGQRVGTVIRCDELLVYLKFTDKWQIYADIIIHDLEHSTVDHSSEIENDDIDAWGETFVSGILTDIATDEGTWVRLEEATTHDRLLHSSVIFRITNPETKPQPLFNS